jgi:hypothetical protein
VAGTASAFGVTNPLYSDWKSEWTMLFDVFEGSGGFRALNKPYLIPHPREWNDHSIAQTAESGEVVKYTTNPNPVDPSPKLKERRKLARYENIASTLVEQLSGAIFREGPKRVFSDNAPEPKAGSKRPIEEFWKDCDGNGTGWDEWLCQGWNSAAVFGHIFIYLEDPPDDMPQRIAPVVRAYTPLDAPDWLVNDRNRLTQIQFLEAAPRESFARVSSISRDVRVRVITEEGWSLQTVDGKAIQAGEHSFGSLPVFVLYARRRTILPIIGKSVLGDPMLHIDLYNLTSEVRELLRKQTFSILNVPIGDGGNVEQAQSLMGRQSGTGNVIFTTLPAAYVSPESTNVEVYHLHMDRLVRTIYRLALLPWETDSKDAEAEGSRQIKREDLNLQLAKYCDELQCTDDAVTDAVYRSVYGPAWETWREKDGLTNNWPDKFDTRAIEDMLEQFSQGITMEMGETATKEIKKRASRLVLPDLSAETQTKIDDEIDASEVITEDERRKDELDVKVGKLNAAMAS